MKFKQLFGSVAAASALLFTTGTHASVIKGGSELLTNADADQLTTWIGQGSAALTKIYSKRAGDQSYTFHNEVDGKGATIVVMRATDSYTGATGIVGGYNPQSWSTGVNWWGSYNMTSNLEDRTAFLFNLSTDSIFRQNKNPNSYYYWGYNDYAMGSYQTYNSSSYGPTFGGGHDLYIDTHLTWGYSYLYSYSNGFGYNNGNYGSTILNTSYTGYGMRIDELEVFTIAQSVEVPEPGNLALFGLALFGLTVVRRSRAKK